MFEFTLQQILYNALNIQSSAASRRIEECDLVVVQKFRNNFQSFLAIITRVKVQVELYG